MWVPAVSWSNKSKISHQMDNISFLLGCYFILQRLFFFCSDRIWFVGIISIYLVVVVLVRIGNKTREKSIDFGSFFSALRDVTSEENRCLFFVCRKKHWDIPFLFFRIGYFHLKFVECFRQLILQFCMGFLQWR